MARFPVIAEYLADGRLGLVTLVLLREVLDESNLRQILDRAAGRTEEIRGKQRLRKVRSKERGQRLVENARQGQRRGLSPRRSPR